MMPSAPAGNAAVNAAVSAGAAAVQTAAAGVYASRSADAAAGHSGSAGHAEPAAGAAGLTNHAVAGNPAVPDAPSVPLDDTQTLIPDPAWACGMAHGIPGPATGQFAFDIDFDLDAIHDVGVTPHGHLRRLDIRGGAIDGAGLRGRVSGYGIEYELTLENGVVEIEQIHMLQLGEERVFMHNCGVSPAANTAARLVLDFEAANTGAYAALNEGRFVATRVYDTHLRLARLKVYRVTSPADITGAVNVHRPASLAAYSTDCQPSTAARGDVLYRGVIDLAGYWSVGESKRGTRNMIPIAGGAFSGKLNGHVLPGGADYQLSAAGALTLDARYLLETDDGELIVVRNCGAVGALVPTFETRSDGRYAWLNQQRYLSADPEPKPDLTGIALTIYEGK